jgi:hypothetical protein
MPAQRNTIFWGVGTMRKAGIWGVGRALPERVLTNADPKTDVIVGLVMCHFHSEGPHTRTLCDLDFVVISPKD